MSRALTDTTIDGVLRSEGSLSIAGAEQLWESELFFHSVSFAGGAPSGGSIDVTAEVTAGGETYRASDTVSF